MKESFSSRVNLLFEICLMGDGKNKFEVKNFDSDSDFRWSLTFIFNPDGQKKKYLEDIKEKGFIPKRYRSEIFTRIVEELFLRRKQNNLGGVINGVEEGLKKPNSGGKQLLLKL